MNAPIWFKYYNFRWEALRSSFPILVKSCIQNSRPKFNNTHTSENEYQSEIPSENPVFNRASKRSDNIPDKIVPQNPTIFRFPFNTSDTISHPPLSIKSINQSSNFQRHFLR